MLRPLITGAAAAATLWAASAAAECPVLLDGKRKPITAREFDSWNSLHEALKGKPAADHAAAKAALCANGVCSATGDVHVLDRDELTVLVISPGGDEPPTFKLYEAVAGALPAYGAMYEITVKPLGGYGEWHHLQAKHEIIGREQMCDTGDCPTASVVQGYEFTDLVFHGARFAFAATCQTDEGDDETPSKVGMVDGRWSYTACGKGKPTQWFTFPDQRTCKAVGGTLKDPKAALKAGRKAAGKKDWAAAIAQFDRLVAHDPGHAGWRAERGYLHFKAGALFKAERDLRDALPWAKADKVKGMILYNLGLALTAQGRKAEALKAFRASDAARPHKAAKAKIKALGG